MLHRQQGRNPSPVQLAIGFVTNFFDTLGIGSFATTTALYKVLRDGDTRFQLDSQSERCVEGIGRDRCGNPVLWSGTPAASV